MNHLKFRIWSKHYEEMLYPAGPTDNQGYSEKYYLQLDGQLRGDFISCGDVDCSNDYEIEQFTGLRDKNGKEIYEGDIVKVWSLFDLLNGERNFMPFEQIFAIEYRPDIAAFVLAKEHLYRPLLNHINPNLPNPLDLEIVGNIHNAIVD